MDYVCLDIETTGTNTVTDKIVQFAAIRYRDGKEVAYFNIMVNPGIPMSAGASEVTGITDEALKNCPRFAEVAQDIADFIGPHPVIMALDVDAIHALSTRGNAYVDYAAKSS